MHFNLEIAVARYLDDAAGTRPVLRYGASS